MKTFVLVVCLCISALAVIAQPGDTLRQLFAPGTGEAQLLHETEGYLRGSFRFTTTVNVMVLSGAGLMGLDLLDGEMNLLSVVGFELGFAGAEMSKYSPVALVKARRSFTRLADAWPDTNSYRAVMQRIRLAEGLSIISVVSTFLSEGLLIVGFTQHDDNMYRLLTSTGIAFGVVALGTSVGTTVATQLARVELGRAAGSVSFGAGSNGVRVVYRLP